MEVSLLVSRQKLELIDILREAAAIPYKNIKFSIFSLLTSFPLLCFLVFYEIVLHRTLVNTSNFLSQFSNLSYSYYDEILDMWVDSVYSINLSLRGLFPQLVQICILYLVPYQLLELFSLVVAVDAASSIYAGEDNKPLSLKEMIRRHLPFEKTRFYGPFITSIYVMFFSTATLFGLMWIVINCYIMFSFSLWNLYGFRSFYHDFSVIVILILHGVAFLALLRKYLEWSAGWNTSIVISVLEETYGAEALDLSAYFSRGSERRGLLLMLVFFLWGLILRLPCLYCGCNESAGGVVVMSAAISLAWLGNVMKWVACMVYFYDCKGRILEKKVDVEVGREVKSVDS